MFEYRDRREHLVPDDWKPGDPWHQHYPGSGFENRDQELEDFVNAEYREFACSGVVKQNNVVVASQTAAAMYVRSAWVSARFVFAMTGAGTVNTEIKVTPTGLPLPDSRWTPGFGHFFYLDSGTGYDTGTAQWDGTNIRMWIAGTGVSNFGIGAGLAIAANDNLTIELRYRPAL